MKPGRWNLLWNLAQSVGVRAKIMGMVLGLILLFGVGDTVMSYLTLSTALTEALQRQGQDVARETAARSIDLLLTRNDFGLHELLKTTLQDTENVRYVFVADPGGQLLAHTFSHGFPVDLLADLRRGDRPPPLEALDTEDGVVWQVTEPILGGRLGTVYVAMSTHQLVSTLARQAQQQLLVTGVMAALGLLATLALTWVLTRPVLDLVEVTQAVGAGDLSRRASPAAPDEVGRLVDTVNRMVDNLAHTRDELAAKEKMRVELLDKVMTAQEDERKRLARELHDETGQSLTSLLVGLRVLEQAADQPEEVRRRTDALRSVVAGTLEEVRRLARELRPSALDDVGLVAALQRYTGDFSRTIGIPVDLQVVGGSGRRLPMRVETAVYRIVQEALTNAARHSGADAISVVLELLPERVRLIVEDSGCGFDPAAVVLRRDGRGLGLFGMQERAALLGGSFTAQSRPGEGTTLFVKIPLEGGGADAAAAGG